MLPRGWLRAAAALVATGLACSLATRPADAAAALPQAAAAGALVLDNSVTSMSRIGDRVYVRGYFSEIGSYTGGGMGIDPSSGASDQSFPLIRGGVSDAIPDGSGGWYVGGSFDVVAGRPPVSLIRVRADGTRDPGFSPALDRGGVYALVWDGARLWVGGEFERVNGIKQFGLAALDARTGARQGPQPGRIETGHDTVVHELSLQPDGRRHGARLFIGDGKGVRSIDPATAQPLPEFRTPKEMQGEVSALAASEERLYAATKSGGLFAVDPGTGALNSGFAHYRYGDRGAHGIDGDVHVIALDGARLLVGGSFQHLGHRKGPVAALHPQTGAPLDAFVPRVDGDVHDLARHGAQLWVTSNNENGSARSRALALDAISGTPTGIASPRVNEEVHAIAGGRANRVYVGGSFDKTAVLGRPGLAAVTLDGRIQDARFSPRPSLALSGSDPHLYEARAGAGRLFLGRRHGEGYCVPCERFYERSSSRIVALDARTGRVTAPRFAPVRNLATFDVGGRRLYLARRLGEQRRFPDNAVEVRDVDTGRLVRSFRLPLPGYVTRMAVIGQRLVVAGSFRRFRPSGQPAHLAVIAVRTSDGRLDPGFDPHVNGPVYDLVADGGRLYLGGLFDNAHGARRRGLAAVGVNSGALVGAFAPTGSYLSLQPLLTVLPRSLLVAASDYPTVLDKRSGAVRHQGDEETSIDAAVPVPGGVLAAVSTSQTDPSQEVLVLLGGL